MEKMRRLLCVLACAAVLALLLATPASRAVANADSSATPTPTPRGGIPVEPPPGWPPAQWASFRQQCMDLFAEMTRRLQMPEEERKGLPPLDMQLREMCLGAIEVPPNPSGPPGPTANPQQTPAPIPPPDAAADPPQLGVISSTAGGAGAACATPPGTQPPDVAGDAGPTQNAELLNQGLWVFDKSGNQLQQETLAQFWCGTKAATGQLLPRCNADGTSSNVLTDTQIAFDPMTQTWFATTMSADPITGVGPVFFAATTTTSAIDSSGNWNRYYINACPSAYPVPDEPILGYSAAWVAIDVLCAISNQPGSFGSDSLQLINPASLKSSPPTISPTPLTPPSFAMRPSRDVSGSGYGELFLAAVNPSASGNMLSLAEVDSSAKLTVLPNSQAVGQPAGSTILPLAPQPGCTPATDPHCQIDLKNSRVEQVVLQYSPATGKHYLASSYTAPYIYVWCELGGGCTHTPATQNLFFFEEVESSTWYTAYFAGGVQQTAFFPSYPSLAIDGDLDVYITQTTFSSTYNPSSSWSAYGIFPSGSTTFARLGGGSPARPRIESAPAVPI